MKYKKKPVVIDAIQLKTMDDKFKVAEFFKGHGAFDMSFAEDGIYINTLEGTMHASIGDWIIRGIKGEFYPCKPNIFEATYEEIL